ncbi:MAG: hypothetical protein IJS67_02460, partial [Clostridia bacterium]|nr:hypothetical protein [Clostridia bacterium]
MSSNLPLFLFHEGTNYKTYEYLGARKATLNGKEGVVFRVWAPNATAVFISGDFNGWNNRAD